MMTMMKMNKMLMMFTNMVRKILKLESDKNKIMVMKKDYNYKLKKTRHEKPDDNLT